MTDPIIHDVFLGWARGTKVNGRPVSKAEIIEENGIFTARLTDSSGTEYVSGSNNRDYQAELRAMKSMFDPER
jgi:hypothetical protein